jgi:SprT protein
MSAKVEEILSRYLPQVAVPQATQWIMVYQIRLKITNKRNTKLGDYKAPLKTEKLHHITVNGDLNPFAFLFVFLHELAHLIVFKQLGHRVEPHGKEWKNAFADLLLFAVGKRYFPADISSEILRYSNKIQASGLGSLELTRAFKKYDFAKPDLKMLEELPQATIFELADGRSFIKGEKLRKRYRCQCLQNKRFYLFNPLAVVMPLTTSVDEMPAAANA